MYLFIHCQELNKSKKILCLYLSAIDQTSSGTEGKVAVYGLTKLYTKEHLDICTREFSSSTLAK
jgi:hypothetical protein